MIKLKPCPRCGGEAYIHSDGWRIWWSVICFDCLHKSRDYRTETEAILAWNNKGGDKI